MGQYPTKANLSGTVSYTSQVIRHCIQQKPFVLTLNRLLFCAFQKIENTFALYIPNSRVRCHIFFDVVNRPVHQNGMERTGLGFISPIVEAEQGSEADYRVVKRLR